MRRKITTTTTAALIASAFAFAPAATAADDGAMENVREIERNVAAIAEHAAKLNEFMDRPNTYSRSAHEFEWNMIDARFDEAGKKIPALQSATNLDPWKKEVIDEIASLMAAMGKQIESGSKILGQTAAVEALVTKSLYPLRIAAVHRYAELIDDHIEALQLWHEPTS